MVIRYSNVAHSMSAALAFACVCSSHSYGMPAVCPSPCVSSRMIVTRTRHQSLTATRAIKRTPLPGWQIWMLAPSVDTVSAIERGGTYVEAQSCYRVTASDVAAAGGYEIESARSALMLLSTAVQGSMEVTNDGQIVFVLPKDCRRILRSRRSPLDAVLARSRAILTTVAKAVFGILLLTSFLAVRPLVDVAIRQIEGAERQKGKLHVSLRSELSCLRASVLNSRENLQNLPEADASLIMACFSFLFGGHDTATTVQDAQMVAIASEIRKNQGAVAVEQLAPFFADPTATQGRDIAGDALTVEDCMIPLLARFEGLPRVIEDGQLIYQFPDLLPTTTRTALQPPALIQGLGQLWKKVMGPDAKDYLQEQVEVLKSQLCD